MKYSQTVKKGKLIKRYKRFLADVELENGEVVTVHTPNTGSMKGCAEPGFIVWIYESENPTRKYQYSWFLVENSEGVKIGINPAGANTLVEEAINNGVIRELQGYDSVKREVKSQSGESRFDLFLQNHPDRADCFVEVKSVTAKGDDGLGIFPDAISARGKKHLDDLVVMVDNGLRAALVFCVQRDDIVQMRAAREIDPVYADALDRAIEKGVEVYAYVARLSPQEVILHTLIPVLKS